MRERRRVTLDAKFGTDIMWLRDEFRPSINGTRGHEFVPVRVVAPNVDAHGATAFCEVTLLIYAYDLYVYGWRNEHSEFHLTDHPQLDPEYALMFSSHYGPRGLGAFAGAPITMPLVCRAVSSMSRVQNRGAANRFHDQVALMAFTVSESLRQDIVAGMFENLFAFRLPGGEIPRSEIRRYANSYSDNIDAGDPYVELPLM